MLLQSVVGRGPRMAAASVTRLVPARAVGSVPRFQAQVSDIANTGSASTANMPPPPPSPVFDTAIPAARERPPPLEESVLASVHPVSTALFQNQDEFWRKIPVWRDVSAKEFLSYSWTVSDGLVWLPLLLIQC